MKKYGLLADQRTDPANLKMAEVRAENPRLRQYGLLVDDMSRRPPSYSLLGSDPLPKHTGQSEYFGVGETWSRSPANRSVQLYNPNIQGQDQKNLLFGENLHAMGREDPGWIEKKKRFYDLLPDWDKEMLRKKHQQMSLPQNQRTDDRIIEAYPNHVENRSYEDWLDQSEMDQWMGALINPPNEEWKNTRWSPEHQALKAEMLEYLRSLK